MSSERLIIELAWLTAAFSALWAAIYYAWLPAGRLWVRQRLFITRQRMFRGAVEGRISWDDVEHRRLECELNALIRQRIVSLPASRPLRARAQSTAGTLVRYAEESQKAERDTELVPV